MIRRLAIPAAVGLAALLVAVALAVLALREDVPAEPAPKTFVRSTMSTSLEPEVHRFGEQVVATLELLVPKQELQPDTVRPVADFTPYEPVGRSRRELVDFGTHYLVRFSVTLRCLRQACLPDPQTADFQFSSAGFTWRAPPPPGRRFVDRRLDERRARGGWEPVKVVSRLTPSDLEGVRWRSALADLPGPTFAIAPRWLVGGLLGAAVALVLAAAALVAGYVRGVRARSEAARVQEETAEPPLERALAFVDAARAAGDAQAQRIALETLAQELRMDGAPDLAGEAERLAWSSGSPNGAALDELTARVRR